MSRAFVKEDSGDVPRRRFALPESWEPGYNAAAALALLEAARDGQMQEAEAATGYRFGEPSLHPHIQKLLDQELARPLADQDSRSIQLARRFLRGL